MTGCYQPGAQNNSVPCDIFLYVLISDDRDLFAESRLDFPVRITDHVHHATTIHQSCVNFNNLISITTQHSHVSINRSQSSLKLLSFNSQSCHQIATDIYNLIVDNSIDVLMSTETWLYSNGDEAYIATMTPAGYEFRSFPRTGCRGGGIGSTFQNTFQKFHCVCVWMWPSCSVCVWCVCVYLSVCVCVCVCMCVCREGVLVLISMYSAVSLTLVRE